MKRLALRDWIGIALIFTFCSALGTLFFKVIPPTNEQIIVYMLGQLSGFVSAVVSFHYITSKGDEDKTSNTGKAFDAIKATAQGTRKVEIDQPSDKPIPVEDRP
tara:strand:- start:1939 stop:2250 length:312 start_codon:yes stop_codon:yes gene_type:complete